MIERRCPRPWSVAKLDRLYHSGDHSGAALFVVVVFGGFPKILKRYRRTRRAYNLPLGIQSATAHTNSTIRTAIAI